MDRVTTSIPRGTSTPRESSYRSPELVHKFPSSMAGVSQTTASGGVSEPPKSGGGFPALGRCTQQVFGARVGLPDVGPEPLGPPGGALHVVFLLLAPHAGPWSLTLGPWTAPLGSPDLSSSGFCFRPLVVLGHSRRRAGGGDFLLAAPPSSPCS